MITVLNLIPEYRGNFELLNLQASLDRRRFKVSVCYLSGEPDGNNRAEAIADRVTYLRCGSLSCRNMTALLRLKRLIDQEQTQIINCHLHKCTRLGILAAALAKVEPAVVCTLHGSSAPPHWCLQMQRMLLYGRLRRLVCVSRELADNVQHMKWASPESTITIQNGLDYTVFLRHLDARRLRSDLLPGFQDHFWFGTAGRLHAIKNQRLLIEAFARVADRLPNAIVAIAGRGELEHELKDLAARLKVADRIRFLGHRNDMDRVLRMLDVFVLPSLQEGLPLALLEAMASARPVIASGVGGIPEVVDASGCAVLIDPACPVQLSEAMVAFYNAPPALREAMGIRGRSRAVTAFSAQRMIHQYEELFADLCRDTGVQTAALNPEWLGRKSRPGHTPA